MAQRRMFSLSVVDTDQFLDMPASTQALYFHLGMRADDDGFISNPRKITSLVNCSTDDLKLLIAKGFIIPFQSGICVVKDWKINNYIQADRYHENRYLQEKSGLNLDEAGAYTVLDTSCIQSVSKMDTQVRLGKDRKELELGEVTSCAEPETVSTPPVISFPLNDGTEFPIFQDQCREWSTLYPAVDVMQQLRNMRGWLLSNPDKRKTRRGIKRFINAWLVKEQDRGGSRTSPKQTPAPPESKDYDVLGMLGVKL